VFALPAPDGAAGFLLSLIMRWHVSDIACARSQLNFELQEFPPFSDAFFVWVLNDLTIEFVHCAPFLLPRSYCVWRVGIRYANTIWPHIARCSFGYIAVLLSQ